MKRSGKNLDSDHTRTDNADTKKKKIEIFLDNKSADKNIKPLCIKKAWKGKNSKVTKNNSTIDKINLLKLKRKRREFGQKSEVQKNSKKDNLKSEKKAATEKTDWLQLKKEKKELKQKRKAKKLNDIGHDKIIRAKQIYEKLRRFDCDPVDRVTFAHMLHDLLKHHYSKVVFMHDMSRVVQCIIKHCEEYVRQEILHEIKSFIVGMLQSFYAQKCVKAILKYGSQEIKSKVIPEFYGNIVKLMSNVVSAQFVDRTYCTWCTKLEQIHFKQEFYGDMYKLQKDENVKSLFDIFETAPHTGLVALSAIKANVIKVLNKNIVVSGLLQTVLWEFLCKCSVEDRSELIVMLRSHIATLARTPIGTRVAVQCIWHGNSKDRKIILKSLKGEINIISTRYSFMILLALFDSVDDTVLMQKIILSELQEDLVDIAQNNYGKHVILYLVARRDPFYFSPNVVEYLRQGDNNSASKKPTDIREKELLEAIRDPLLDAIIADTATWLSNSSMAMITLAILKVGSGEKLKTAFESIAKFITNVDFKINDCYVCEHAGIHAMLKKLIKNDKELRLKNEFTFGETIISYLTPKVLKKWIEFNRACFLLIVLIEHEFDEVKHMLLSRLKDFSENLKTTCGAGALILLKKLKEIDIILDVIVNKYNI